MQIFANETANLVITQYLANTYIYFSWEDTGNGFMPPSLFRDSSSFMVVSA